MSTRYLSICFYSFFLINCHFHNQDLQINDAVPGSWLKEEVISGSGDLTCRKSGDLARGELITGKFGTHQGLIDRTLAGQVTEVNFRGGTFKQDSETKNLWHYDGSGTTVYIYFSSNTKLGTTAQVMESWEYTQFQSFLEGDSSIDPATTGLLYVCYATRIEENISGTVVEEFNNFDIVTSGPAEDHIVKRQCQAIYHEKPSDVDDQRSAPVTYLYTINHMWQNGDLYKGDDAVAFATAERIAWDGSQWERKSIPDPLSQEVNPEEKTEDLHGPYLLKLNSKERLSLPGVFPDIDVKAKTIFHRANDLYAQFRNNPFDVKMKCTVCKQGDVASNHCQNYQVADIISRDGGSEYLCGLMVLSTGNSACN